MTQHTPGPWHIGRDPNRVFRGYTQHIATTHKVMSGSPEANARLIAAAPDAIDAHKTIAELANELFVNTTNRQDEPFIKYARKIAASILHASLTAIAKAEGKE